MGGSQQGGGGGQVGQLGGGSQFGGGPNFGGPQFGPNQQFGPSGVDPITSLGNVRGPGGPIGGGPGAGNNFPGTTIPNEPLVQPNGGLTPIAPGVPPGQTTNPLGTRGLNPGGGFQDARHGGGGHGGGMGPQGKGPGGGQGGGGQGGGQGGQPLGPSLISGGIQTPYWQQQYQQNPSNVQAYYSPPAANQLSQFFPGLSIFPGGGGGGGGGGKGGGAGGGPGAGFGGGPGGGGQATPFIGQPQQIVGQLGGGINA